MKKSKNPLIKQIKAQIKKQQLWKKYKQTFENKQMRFLISNLAEVFGVQFDYQQLYNLEISLINKNDKKMYCNVVASLFSAIDNQKNHQINTDNLAYFLYYIYQTSRYYSDKKNNIPNVFWSNDNLEVTWITQKNIKRNYYYAFVEDLKKVYPEYNDYVIKLLKLVL